MSTKFDKLKSFKVGLIIAILANILWGFSFLASKFTLLAWKPFTASSLRFGIATIALFVILKSVGKKIEVPKNKKHWIDLILLATFSFGLLYPLQLSGLRYISTGYSAAIMLTSPIFVIIIDRIFLGHKLNYKKWIALGLGLFGGVILISASLTTKLLYGSILTLSSSLFLALSVILAKRCSRDFSSSSITFWSMAIGSLELAIASYFIEGNDFSNISENVSFVSWVSLLFLALVCSAFCFFIWNFALAHSKPQEIASSMHIKTPTAVLLGIVVLNEPVTTEIMIGTFLIMLGVWLSQIFDSIDDEQHSHQKNIQYERSRQLVHDIRNPLETLESLISLNRKRILTGNEKQLIIDCTNRISQLSNSLLFMEKESQPQKGSPEFDLVSVVKSCVEQRASTFSAQKVHFIYECDAILKILKVFGNDLDFYRALNNLLKNACESFGGKVGVVTVRMTASTNKAKISIIDNGKGMSRQTQERIMKGEFTNKAEGSGLGLKQVRETISAMDGNIEIESNLGQGTTITLTLPLLGLANYVLIDDDRIIRANWKIHADKMNINLVCFEDVEGFIKVHESIPKNAIVCVDSCLKNGIKGEEASREIFSKGFISIYLATGMPDIDISNYPWLIRVIGKKPVFVY